MLNPGDPCSLCYGYCHTINCCISDFEYTDNNGQQLTGFEAYEAYISDINNNRHDEYDSFNNK